MPLSDQKRDELSQKARGLANEVSIGISSPDSKTGGKSEFRMMVNFFARKKNIDMLKQLLTTTPPKRSKQTQEYWEVIRGSVINYLDNPGYSVDELIYLFSWTARLLNRS